MNIIQILWKLGWDVLSFNEDGEYKIQLGKSRKDLTDKQIEEGSIGYIGSTRDIYTVKVEAVGFNGIGDFYVFFKEVSSGVLIDGYEYKNMDADELFD